MKFMDDLPQSRTYRPEPIDWASAKQELMENEGKWGLVAEDVASSTAQQLRTGRNKAFRGEELKHFEFRVKRPEEPEVPYGPRRTDLWGRYSARP